MMKHIGISTTMIALVLTAVMSTEVMAVIRVTIRPVTLQSASASDTLVTLPASQTQFLPGQSFVLELWAQTTETNGLSSVTVDMSFVNTVVTAQTITHSALFNATSLSTGAINNPAGLIDDIGGSHTAADPPCSDQVGLANWVRVAVVDMQALANGTSLIQTADSASLILGIAVCNEFGNVIPADVDFGQITVTVQECFNNTDCDDAQFCNGPEQCVGNVCQAGTNPNCADAIGCTDDSCDFTANANTGACVNAVNDANCDDNQFCNGVETCSATLDCQAGINPNCADAIGCTDDSCDFAANANTGACVNVVNDANCDDSQFCNGVETCNATLDCQAGTNPNCADAIGCTDDSCDFTANANTGACVNAVNDANCDDSQFCNGVETCNATLDCQAGINPNCADAIGCTDDSCDFTANANTGACVNAVNDANCDDSQFCNGVETCNATLDCQAGINPNCADAIGCTDDSCDFTANANTGACVNAVNDANCDDSQFCNGVEICSATLDCQPGAAVCTATCEHCDELSSTCELCILDLDFNGIMGTGDFALFAACFDGCYLATDPCAASNFDGDNGNCVGTGDYSGFVGCFGQFCSECLNCAGPPPPGISSRSFTTAADTVISLVTVLTPTFDDIQANLPLSKTSFALGQPFLVEVWATRPVAFDGDGLAAVFVDLSFEGRSLVTDKVISSTSMSTFAGGIIHPGLGVVSQLGGCTKLDSSNLGADGMWVRVATLAVRAVAYGDITFTVSASDPIHGISIVNNLGNLDPFRIDFGLSTVNIMSKPKVGKAFRRLR